MATKQHAAPRHYGTNAERTAFSTLGMVRGTLWVETDTLDVFFWSGSSWKGMSGSPFTSDIVLDDGVGDSPAVVFFGGTNDDGASMFLRDDAVAGDSDLVIRLCADDSDSQLQIQDVTGITVLALDADGNIILDDGTGDSPAIQFFGGSHDDGASLFLDDDAAAGKSDLVVRLPGTSNDSQLQIQDNDGVIMLGIDANGNIVFTDAAWFGLSSTAARMQVASAPRSTFNFLDTKVTIGSTTPALNLAFRIEQSGAKHIELLDTTANVATRVVQAGDALLLDVNRDPISGNFDDTNMAHARITLQTADADSHIIFYTKDANNVIAAERVRIDKAGNVGIKTSGPAAATEINEATATRPVLILQTTDDNAANPILELQDSAGATLLHVHGNSDLVLLQQVFM